MDSNGIEIKIGLLVLLSTLKTYRCVLEKKALRSHNRNDEGVRQRVYYGRSYLRDVYNRGVQYTTLNPCERAGVRVKIPVFLVRVILLEKALKMVTVSGSRRRGWKQEEPRGYGNKLYTGVKGIRIFTSCTGGKITRRIDE